MDLHVINTGNFKLDGGAMFGVVPKVMWEKLYPADEKNLCNWAMRCLLIVTENRRILIDSGIGDKQDEKFLSHYYLNGNDTLEKSLNAVGYSFDDITDNIISHLHFDHCGGSIRYNEDKTKLIPSFKNATYWISKKQWDWATKPNRREKASFLKENIIPIQESGKLNLIETEVEIDDIIKLKLFDGHTDGQIIPIITYNEAKIAFMADLLPAVAHIPIPFVMSYDTRPLLTLKDKESFLNEALDKNYYLFFEHDLYNECCSLSLTEKGIRADKIYKLSEIVEKYKS